jgi:hypothetical protein
LSYKINENWHRYQSLLRDPEYPIYVQNTTDNIVEWKMFDSDDFICAYDHPNRYQSFRFRIWPGEILNLREIMSEQPFHSSLILDWYIKTDRFKVLNERNWQIDPLDDPAVKKLRKLSAKPIRRHSVRYYAIQARRKEIEHIHPR